MLPGTLRDSLFVVIVIGALVGVARAQALAYDGFGNGPYPTLAGSTGGTGWSGPWAMAGDDVTTIALTGLSWPDLATTPGSAFTPTAGGAWPNSVFQRALPALPPGTTSLYVSFLLRYDALWGMWGGLSFGTYPHEMTVGSPLGYYTYGLMLSEGLGDVSNKPLVVGETTLVVVRISLNTPASGITYRLYLDPAIGSPEPGFPDAVMSVAAVGALPGFVSIDNGTGFTTDEIRVGTSWSSVLPADVAWADLGFAKAGLYGTPEMQASGLLEAGTTTQINLTKAMPYGMAQVVYGLQAIYAPFKGGTLVPLPQGLVPMVTDATGSAHLTFAMPAGLPAGTTLTFQTWMLESVSFKLYAATNAMQGVTP